MTTVERQAIAESMRKLRDDAATRAGAARSHLDSLGMIHLALTYSASYVRLRREIEDICR